MRGKAGTIASRSEEEVVEGELGFEEGRGGRGGDDVELELETAVG